MTDAAAHPEGGVRYYRHSGQLGSGLAVVPVTALTAGLAAGIAYGFISRWNPLIYIGILLPVGLAYVLGLAVGHAGRLARCRSTRCLAMGGLGAGLLGLYAGWAAFDCAILSGMTAPPGAVMPGLLDFLLSPGLVWEVTGLVGRNGWFTLGSSTPTGAILWILWIAEAGIVVLGTPYVAGKVIAPLVYCEGCGRWCDGQKGGMLFAVPKTAVVERLAQGDAAALEELKTHEPGAMQTMRIDMQKCASCDQTATYHFVKITKTKDKNGKISEATADLTPRILASGEELRMLQEWLALTRKKKIENAQAAAKAKAAARQEKAAPGSPSAATEGSPPAQEPDAPSKDA